MPLSVGLAVFLIMATWRWGRKATFNAYAARSTLTMQDLVDLHRSCTVFLERNALILAPTQVRHLTDNAPMLVQLLCGLHVSIPRILGTRGDIPKTRVGQVQSADIDKPGSDSKCR